MTCVSFCPLRETTRQQLEHSTTRQQLEHSRISAKLGRMGRRTAGGRTASSRFRSQLTTSVGFQLVRCASWRQSSTCSRWSEYFLASSSRVAGFWMSCHCMLASPPVPAVPPKLNRWRHPDSAPMRRQYPISGHPNPAATHPVPIAVYPNVARPRRDTNGTGHHCGRRRWRRRADNDAQIYVRCRG